jgi:predicted nuclease with RNAse H fold
MDREAYCGRMLTVGVDLAAGAVKTAVAWIEWSSGAVSVRDIRTGADDVQVIEAITGADKSGIDCPFGWPEPFIDFVSAHRAGKVVTPEGVAGLDWRRRLAYRTTDEVVRKIVGRPPLSVSADRIGHTAMRCAHLLAQLAERDQPIDRRGGGAVVEVYPAASLRQWGLPDRGYKGPGNSEPLGLLIDRLQMAAPWLDFGQHEQTCRGSDDATDAVVAALTARAAHQGLVVRPTSEQARIAETEGWIVLPEKNSLGEIAGDRAEL